MGPRSGNGGPAFPPSLMAFKRGHQPPASAQVPQVGILATSAVCKLPGKGRGFLPWWFWGQQAGWQISLPLGPTWEGPYQVASADCTLSFFLPLVGSMSKHFIHHGQTVRAVLLPLGLPLKEQLDIHNSFGFPHGLTFLGCLPFGSCNLIPLTLKFLYH